MSAKLVTVAEAAKLKGVSRSAIYAAIGDGLIKAKCSQSV